MTRAKFLDIKIPRRYRNAHIDNEQVRDWAEGFLSGSPTSLYLCGPVGSGKSHLAWATYATLLALHPMPSDRVEAWQVVEMLDAMRPDGEPETFSRVKRASILLLDDLGAEKPTDWATERLFAVVDARYNAMKATIYTSNLPPDQIATRLGERVASRLAEDTLVVPLLGQDRRRVTSTA